MEEAADYTDVFDYFARTYEAVNSMKEATVLLSSVEIADNLQQHFGLEIPAHIVHQHLMAMKYQPYTVEQSGRIVWLLRQW